MDEHASGSEGNAGVGTDGTGVSPDDVLEYHSVLTGVAVYRQSGFVESTHGRERTIARHLADHGVGVVLRAVGKLGGQKTPDAWLVEAAGVCDPEFKRIGADASNYPRAVNWSVRQGAHQARCVVVFVDRGEVCLTECVRGIRGKLRDDRRRGVDTVDWLIIVMYDGSVHTFSAQEILDGPALPGAEGSG